VEEPTVAEVVEEAPVLEEPMSEAVSMEAVEAADSQPAPPVSEEAPQTPEE
jgi:hypothetical protein